VAVGLDFCSSACQKSICVYILGSVELSLYLEIFMKDYAFHCEFLLLMASDEFLIGS